VPRLFTYSYVLRSKAKIKNTQEISVAEITYSMLVFIRLLNLEADASSFRDIIVNF